MHLPALLLLATLATASDKPKVSVLYFDNQTGKQEYDVLRKGLADMMIVDLVAWDGVEVVEREKLEAVLAELKLQRTKAFDQATAAKLGKFLGAHYLVSGTIVAVDPQLALTARMVKAEGSVVVAEAKVQGPKDKVFDLEQELVDKLTASVDLKVKNLAARRKVKAPNLEALLAYSTAIDLSDAGKEQEAQAKMQEVVSKAPGFLMAREKKEEILKKLKEVEKRRADMVTESALELARRTAAVLKETAAFESLDEKGQKRRLAARVAQARFLARLLKKSLSWRRESFRVVLAGKEKDAEKVVRGWIDNQRALVLEVAAHEAAFRNASPSLDDPELQNLMRDAKLGALEVRQPFEDLLSFVIDGRVRDGDDTYTVAPTPGDLDAKERQAVLDELDARVKKALEGALQADAAKKEHAEYRAQALLELKAETLEHLGRDEEAIAEHQRLLDAFPTGSRASWAERRIKELIGVSHVHERDCRERWLKAMKDGCADDMDLRVGTGTVLHDRMKRQGLAALAAHAAEMEKACKPTPRNRGAMAGVYRDLALEGAAHEDCKAYQAWFTKYVEAGGSIGDMKGYAKNWAPQCDLGNVVAKVMWMYGKLDRNWSFEFDRHLVSILSYDGKMLTLNAGREARPESFALYLDSTGPGKFTCRSAQWQRAGDERLEGKCTVQLTKLAAEKGEYDEGSFTATFEIQEPAYKRKMEMSDATFRLRRE